MESRADFSDASDAADIVASDSGITLLKGWSAAQEEGGRLSRTIQSSASLTLTLPSSVTRIVAFEVEPLGGDSPELIILGEGDVPLAGVTVYGPQRVRAVIPGSSRPVPLKLRVGGVSGGKGPALRVTRVEAYRSFGDIASARDGLRLGRNWYGLEVYDGRTFRWASTDVELELLEWFDGDALELELEPGPGVGEGPLVLVALTSDERELVRTTTRRGLRLRLRIPLDGVRVPGAIRLRADSAGAGSSGDPRILNFRVFEITVVGGAAATRNGSH